MFTIGKLVITFFSWLFSKTNRLGTEKCQFIDTSVFLYTHLANVKTS